MAEQDRDAGGVLVQVCLKCGKQYSFDRQEPPEDMSCDKCGGGVFRSFFAATKEGEAAEDFRESTERDTLTTDPGTDITRGDLHDLGNM
jgi:predicted  nucleic acid-binding Zn-ribbon protein